MLTRRSIMGFLAALVATPAAAKLTDAPPHEVLMEPEDICPPAPAARGYDVTQPVQILSREDMTFFPAKPGDVAYNINDGRIYVYDGVGFLQPATDYSANVLGQR